MHSIFLLQTGQIVISQCEVQKEMLVYLSNSSTKQVYDILPTAIVRPLYRTTCVSWHPRLTTGGFCWNKGLMLACPCWWQLLIQIREKTLQFSSTVLPASSPYRDMWYRIQVIQINDVSNLHGNEHFIIICWINLHGKWWFIFRLYLTWFHVLWFRIAG